MPYYVIRDFLLHPLTWPGGSEWVIDVGDDYAAYLRQWTQVGFRPLIMGDAYQIACAHYVGRTTIRDTVTFGTQPHDVA